MTKIVMLDYIPMLNNGGHRHPADIKPSMINSLLDSMSIILTSLCTFCEQLSLNEAIIVNLGINTLDQLLMSQAGRYLLLYYCIYALELYTVCYSTLSLILLYLIQLNYILLTNIVGYLQYSCSEIANLVYTYILLEGLLDVSELDALVVETLLDYLWVPCDLIIRYYRAYWYFEGVYFNLNIPYVQRSAYWLCVVIWNNIGWWTYQLMIIGWYSLSCLCIRLVPTILAIINLILTYIDLIIYLYDIYSNYSNMTWLGILYSTINSIIRYDISRIHAYQHLLTVIIPNYCLAIYNSGLILSSLLLDIYHYQIGLTILALQYLVAPLYISCSLLIYILCYIMTELLYSRSFYIDLLLRLLEIIYLDILVNSLISIIILILSVDVAYLIQLQVIILSQYINIISGYVAMPTTILITWYLYNIAVYIYYLVDYIATISTLIIWLLERILWVYGICANNIEPVVIDLPQLTLTSLDALLNQLLSEWCLLDAIMNVVTSVILLITVSCLGVLRIILFIAVYPVYCIGVLLLNTLLQVVVGLISYIIGTFMNAIILICDIYVYSIHRPFLPLIMYVYFVAAIILEPIIDIIHTIILAEHALFNTYCYIIFDILQPLHLQAFEFYRDLIWLIADLILAYIDLIRSTLVEGIISFIKWRLEQDFQLVYDICEFYLDEVKPRIIRYWNIYSRWVRFLIYCAGNNINLLVLLYVQFKGYTLPMIILFDLTRIQLYATIPVIISSYIYQGILQTMLIISYYNTLLVATLEFIQIWLTILSVSPEMLYTSTLGILLRSYYLLYEILLLEPTWVLFECLSTCVGLVELYLVTVETTVSNILIIDLILMEVLLEDIRQVATILTCILDWYILETCLDMQYADILLLMSSGLQSTVLNTIFDLLSLLGLLDETSIRFILELTVQVCTIPAALYSTIIYPYIVLVTRCLLYLPDVVQLYLTIGEYLLRETLYQLLIDWASCKLYSYNLYLLELYNIYYFWLSLLEKYWTFTYHIYNYTTLVELSPDLLISLISYIIDICILSLELLLEDIRWGSTIFVNLLDWYLLDTQLNIQYIDILLITSYSVQNTLLTVVFYILNLCGILNEISIQILFEITVQICTILATIYCTVVLPYILIILEILSYLPEIVQLYLDIGEHLLLEILWQLLIDLLYYRAYDYILIAQLLCKVTYLLYIVLEQLLLVIIDLYIYIIGDLLIIGSCHVGNHIIDILCSAENVYFLYFMIFIGYLLCGIFAFFYHGYLGTRGIFYLSEMIIMGILIFSIVTLYYNLKYHLALDIILGELALSNEVIFTNIITFDILSILGVLLVATLTAIILTFGVEYMLREAFAYNVLATLVLFSASIICFIVSYSFGLMIIFWEISGTLSLFLIDMYYARIRTTQAVTRTFALNRFGDLWMFTASIEIYSLCHNDALPTLFALLPYAQFNLSILGNLIFDFTIPTVIVFSIFSAAACKCAQFLLFVWLPDAMEAPTPASALIHSSTLVVMGIFMILRFAPILHLSVYTLYIMSILGSLTVAYGAILATQTSDLKKAVAYSTISQIGYLFTGCAFLAFRATLIYLILHAICKALLFVLVGYIVHMFGGTTSLRRMGGIYYIVPDIAIYMFILCMVLAGAPYTVGFFAKELIVTTLTNTSSPVATFIICCWIISFACTPFYLYRICVLPLFGRPRCSRRVFRNIVSPQSTYNFIDSDSSLNSLLHKFTNLITRWSVQGRFTNLLHLLLLLIVLFCGEFLVFLVTGLFGTSTTLFSDTAIDDSVYQLTDYYLLSYYRVRNIQLLIIVLFALVTLYITAINNQLTFNIIYLSVVLPILAIIFICLGHYFLVDFTVYIYNISNSLIFELLCDLAIC
uniref:NADH-ubiquinone oxidoreductase chain 5 n=3 Tax=Nyctotherus ovalis TaxID=70075 RepID=NU5H_NYCOV|nr:RecName: Full=NADH-ubiquinone oxidoreductase chain 5; AltName: Full=NADH dehydrogenase subunit 5 [Nyctotherus ovalis]CAI38858.1 NADH dehydrogenase subunit 5 [Nyctotherus ovalis]